MLSHADATQFLAGRINYERMQSMPRSEAAMKLDRMRDLLRRLGNPHLGIPIIHVAGTKGKGSTSAMIAAMLSAAGYRTGLFTSPHIERVEERMAIDGRPCSAEEFAELVDWVRPAVEAMDQEAAKHVPLLGTSSALGASASAVGWVERSEPHQNNSNDMVGRAALDPPYKTAGQQTPAFGPTYFEILTAMAFGFFARRGAAAVVLEVGLGGRLDSTNVCKPCVSVITNISLDHTKQLGETPAAIAAEKAGIIKPGVPVVSGVTLDEPREVIHRVAQENGCQLAELGVDFSFDYHAPRHLEREAGEEGRGARDGGTTSASFDYCHSDRGEESRGEESGRQRTESFRVPLACIALGLLGRHQAANAAVALAVMEELRRAGWTIPEAAARRGLAEIRWPARVEIVARRPVVILDAAHNAASIAALVEVLEESFSVNRRFLLFATTQEKDLRGMLRLLVGRFDHILFTRYANNPRGVPPEELLELANEMAECVKHVGWVERGEPHQNDTNDAVGLAALDPPYGRPARKTTMTAIPTTAEAWREIKHRAGPDDLICIAGSFFLASEMRGLINVCPE